MLALEVGVVSIALELALRCAAAGTSDNDTPRSSTAAVLLLE